MNEQQQQQQSTPKTWTFQGQEIYFEEKQYQNGGLAIQAWMIEDEFFAVPYAKISVNIPGESEQLPKNAFYLKDYAENIEIARAMLEEGVIKRVDGEEAQSGFIVVGPCEFTVYGKQFIVK